MGAGAAALEPEAAGCAGAGFAGALDGAVGVLWAWSLVAGVLADGFSSEVALLWHPAVMATASKSAMREMCLTDMSKSFSPCVTWIALVSDATPHGIAACFRQV